MRPVSVIAVSVAVLLVVAVPLGVGVLPAVPASSNGGNGGDDFYQVNATDSTESTRTGAGTGQSPGGTLSAFIESQGADVSSEISLRSLNRRFDGADDEKKADIIADEYAELEG
ncbi:MAG: hypothetical protein SXQ77_12470, partial [Halobacteria archaeon]|nr:hypothetical protein [Halobacteria archaeon]